MLQDAFILDGGAAGIFVWVGKVSLKGQCSVLEAGLWIWICMDPRSFSLLDPDPVPGGIIFQIKTEKLAGNW